MRKIIKYKSILHSQEHLDKVVNKLIGEGWIPWESPTAFMCGSSINILQVMVKHDE